MGISFNSRKATKNLLYLRGRASESEMDASSNSAENSGVLLVLLCSLYTAQGLHKLKSFQTEIPTVKSPVGLFWFDFLAQNWHG